MVGFRPQAGYGKTILTRQTFVARPSQTTGGIVYRMVKKAVQQGRSERRGESYFVPYVEPLSDARTPLADFFNILIEV